MMAFGAMLMWEKLLIKYSCSQIDFVRSRQLSLFSYVLDFLNATQLAASTSASWFLSQPQRKEINPKGKLRNAFYGAWTKRVVGIQLQKNEDRNVYFDILPGMMWKRWVNTEKPVAVPLENSHKSC